MGDATSSKAAHAAAQEPIRTAARANCFGMCEVFATSRISNVLFAGIPFILSPVPA